MGGIGAFAEPLVVITLLIGGTWINRNTDALRIRARRHVRRASNDVEEGIRDQRSSSSDGLLANTDGYRSSSPSLLVTQEPTWRKRRIGVLGFKKEVTTPNTRRFRGYVLSRVLERFPFLVECWYWALIYWVYQLGRAATAVFIVEGTVKAARHHALQLIKLEQRLGIFWELPIQRFFMRSPVIMIWINRIYSFIHIPGSIAFLVFLFYYTNTRSTIHDSTRPQSPDSQSSQISQATKHKNTPVGPRLYESRRRTMALCNLLAFIIFTIWPCMPPRLLSADDSKSEEGKLARSYGFIDTVHGEGGEGSVWTQNRFCNQYAAMPSLHFGYSLLIGLTILTLPLTPASTPKFLRLPFMNNSHPRLAPRIPLPSSRRLLCIVVGVLYPAIILVAILATANHFILDAVAGAMVCGIAWFANDILLNLLVVEDYFLWCVRIHKPEAVEVNLEDRWTATKGVSRQ